MSIYERKGLKMNYTHDDIEDATELAELVAKFYTGLKQEENYYPILISNMLIRIGLEITISEICCCEEMDEHTKAKLLLQLKSRIYDQFQKSIDEHIYGRGQNGV